MSITATKGYVYAAKPAARTETAAEPIRLGPTKHYHSALKAIFVLSLTAGSLLFMACGVMVTTQFAGQPYPVVEELGTTGMSLAFAGGFAIIALAACGLACLNASADALTRRL